MNRDFVKHEGEANIFLNSLTKKEREKYLIIAERWFKTQEALREFFNTALKDKCKDCKNCCCRNCQTAGGYFKVFDYVMFNLMGYKIPEISEREKGFITEKGCNLNPKKRSFICCTYSCDKLQSYKKPIFSLIKQIWNKIEFIISNDYKDIKKVKKALETFIDSGMGGILDNLLYILNDNSMKQEIYNNLKIKVSYLFPEFKEMFKEEINNEGEKWNITL